ncbi:alkaline phosphatase family protein [Polaribacter sp. Z014]|uniref:alkaline phosphatase family protein n=1 Tax=Polaribacter sp. Z014 TaxID=2927126 RepID=UPI002020926E|nr:alkaline phosphatase family protein [Polaribacter sp. Z014]MCL7764195.1 alkaline phosphatase family protein [Polaribacter sp. Z014]
MKRLKLLSVFFLLMLAACSSEKKEIKKILKDDSNKVFVITLDGLRWQELFSGADSLLVENKEYVSDTKGLKTQFWRDSATERRKVLFPFIWNEVAKMGQIHGNRWQGSKMNVTNGMHFSYPGYNEILTGKADDARIDSNRKIPNPNLTILEIAENTEAYKGKVAAFGSWDVFPFIINEERSGLYVNAGFREAKGTDLSDKEVFLNELQAETPSPWGGVRLDVFTHHYALETIKKKHPKLVFISYGETDDFAHDGEYDAYLRSANRTDAFIQKLWNYTQKDLFYKGKTTFIITTDHGRGTAPLETWKHHGDAIKDSDQVWVLSFGNEIASEGEIITEEQLYTNQVAASVAKLLDVEMITDSIGKPFYFIK